jgi:hypothetical protein
MAPPHPTGRGARPWLVPVTAAGLTLLIGILGVGIALRYLVFPPAGPQSLAAVRDRMAQHVSAGQQALVDREYALARKEFEAARTLRQQHPQAMSGADSRQLNQLFRQTDLLADRLPNLRDLIELRKGTKNDHDWDFLFKGRYQGKAVFFDVTVSEPGGQPYQVDRFHPHPGLEGMSPELVRLHLQDLKLLQNIRPSTPVRLLFGARLADLRNEGVGEQSLRVIHLQPDSGVLLTDAGAVASLLQQPLDNDLQALLKQQADWAADLPEDGR